jgi:osmotically-inducible protein OsmY
MTTANLTHADVRLKNAVTRQLEWDPEVEASAVGVTVRGAAVTLTGFIDTYAAKLAVERAAKRIHGVRAVANDIEVRLRLGRTDADIAQDAARVLEVQSTVPEGVQAAVHNGTVSLTGRVYWLFQKQAAERVVRHIRGVRHIFNHITVAPLAAVHDVQRHIARALHRNADLDANRITVTVSGTTATLAGTVGTFLQRESAERAAAQAPGIAHVDNCITVEPAAEFPADDDFDALC